MPKTESNGLSPALIIPGTDPIGPTGTNNNAGTGVVTAAAGTSANNATATSVINITTGSIMSNNGTGNRGPVLMGGPLPPVSDIGAEMPQKKFPCHLCRRSFMHKQSLDIHMRSHTGKNFFINYNSCEVIRNPWWQGQRVLLKNHNYVVNMFHFINSLYVNYY